MTFFIISLLILAGLAATVRAVVRNDRGQLPPPGSRTVDPSFLPPGSILSRH